MAFFDNFQTEKPKSFFDNFQMPTVSGGSSSSSIPNIVNQNFSMGGSSTPAFTNTNITPTSVFKSIVSGVKKVPGIIASIPKMAMQDLFVTPAVRATQATATLAGSQNPSLTGEEDITIKTLFGEYTVPAQKNFVGEGDNGLGATKQITGQALTSLSWLIAPEKLVGLGKGIVTNASIQAVKTGGSIFTERVVKDIFTNTIKQGFKSGALVGGIQAAGASFSKGEDMVDIAKDTAIGAVFGGALGATTAGSIAGISIVKNKAKFIEDTLVKEFVAKGMSEAQARTLATQGGFFKNPLGQPELPPQKPSLLQKSSNQIDSSSVQSPSQINVSSPNSTPIDDPVKQITEALKAAKPVRAKQEALYSAERSKRIGAVVGVGKNIPGEQGYFAQLGQLKGELPKVQFESIRKSMSQNNVDELFNLVEKSNITPFEKISAKGGLAKMLGAEGGTVPTKGEISLLSEIFPPEFMKAVMEKRPFTEKLWGGFKDALNLPRAMMATADLSAPLRQGIMLVGKPKQWAPAFAKMFKYAFSENAYKGLMKDIQSRPTYQLMRENKLALTEVGEVLSKREESFMSNLVERIPLFGRLAKASNRAYSGFLNKLRADVFDDLVGKAEGLGLTKDNPKLTADIAKFVNTATGRGELPEVLAGATELLNGAFFSPRLMASRLQSLNPNYYVGLDPFVRKEALKALFTTTGVGLSVLGLAKLSGAEVSVDPRSADFGKIKLGNTRYDPWGGFQQYVVLASRLATGEMVNSSTGKEFKLGEGYKPTTRLDIIQRFFESKTSPVASFVLGLLKGQTATGEKINVPADVADRFLPMMAQDMFDLYRENGPKGLGMAIPGVFGVGSQTYTDQIPMNSKTPTGKDSIEWRQAPNLGETLINKVTGKEVTTIPEAEQQKLRDEKLAQTKRDIELTKAKSLVLETGEPQDVGDTHVFLDNGVVKTSTSENAVFYAQIQTLKAEGKIEEAQDVVRAMTVEEYKTYDSYRKTRNTRTMNNFLKEDPAKAVEFVRAQSPAEQQRLLKTMDDTEYKLYESGKK